NVLHIPETKLRVIAPDVGGGFGSKIFHYAEEAIVTWAAGKVRKPVKWTAERSESFMSDAHGRDHVTHVELALDKDAKFTALKVSTVANMGAYLSTFATSVPTYLYGTLLAGTYTTPAIYVETKAVFTNTVPVDAYRGAGRPEATFVVERIVDLAADELGMVTAKGTRRHSPSSSPRISASRSTRSRSSTATRTNCRSAWELTARVRWRSAAARSSRRWTRSSPRAARSPPICSKPPRPMSSSR